MTRETTLDLHPEVYDPECERFDTAVKAIWLLYRWGMWGYLTQIGLEKRAVEQEFARFDYEHIVGERGRIRTEEQCFHLIRYCPVVLSAAMLMMKRYAAVTSVSRSDYYQHRRLVEEWVAEFGLLPEVKPGRPRKKGV